MGKSSTNTTSTSSQPNPIVQGAATDIAHRASDAINTLTPQQLVPDANPDMQSAWGLTRDAIYSASPYYGAAGNSYADATQPLYDTVGRYMSPYTQSVVDATQRQFNNQNAIAQQGIVGNAAAQGAWGGDRSAMAQGILAGQQQTVQAPVIAGLYNQGYNTALGAAEAQNWQRLQAAQGLQGLGSGVFGTGVAGANALYGAGSQQYGLQQAQNTIPLQIPQYEAGLLGTVAGTLGGTSSTTSPAASPFSQAAGLGIGAVGLAGATGGFGDNGYLSNLIGGGAGGGSALTNADYGGGGLFAQRGGRIGHYAPGGIVSMGIGAPNSFNFNSADPFDFATAPVPHASAGSSNPLAPITTTTQTQSGGGGGILGDILGVAKFAAPFFLNRGGIVGYAGGGAVDDDTGFQHPRGGFMPSVFLIPRGVGGGMGIPRPPTGLPAGQNPPGVIDTTPGAIMGMLKSTGAIGDKGWLTHGSDYAAGGEVDRRRAGAFDMPPGGTGAWTTDGGLLDARRGPDGTWGDYGHHDLPRYAEGGDLDPGILAESGMPPDMVARIMAAPSPSREVTVSEGNGVPYVPPRSAGIASPQRGRSEASIIASESGGDPWVGYTPPGEARVNLKDKPLDQYGFPVWEGRMGPEGISHAAGLYQFQPGTWARYAGPLGVKDFSPESQKRVYDAARSVEGDAPWAASAGSSGSGGGQPRGIAGISVADAGGGGDAPSAGVGIVPRASTLTSSQIDDIKSDSLRGSGVSPWMALAAAGFGMAAGRSPSAMQNIGAGALEGLKFLETQRASQPKLRLESAQATAAETEVERLKAARAYYAGQGGVGAQSWTPQTGADALDKAIDAVGKGVAKGPNTVAIPVPGGAAAPAPSAAAPAPVKGAAGNLPPPTREELVQSAATQANIREIDHAINVQRQLGKDPADPAITNLIIRRSQLITEDPLYKRAVAAGTALAETPGKIALAGGEEAARSAQRIETGRPGSYILRGGAPIGSVPQHQEVIDPVTGRSSPAYVNPPLPSQMGAGAEPHAVAGPGGQPLISKLGPGEHAEMTGQGETANKEREETQAGAQSAQQQSAILNNMANNADKFWTGRFADLVGDAQSYLRLINPKYDEPVASREQFVKDAGNLTRSATREVSSRAAYQEVQFIQSTLPNPEMSPLGIRRVVGELQGLNDYKIAKARAMDAWMQQHGNSARGFETSWQSQAPVTPYTFVISRMEPAERQELFGKWSKTDAGRAELQRLKGQDAYASQNGLYR